MKLTTEPAMEQSLGLSSEPQPSIIRRVGVQVGLRYLLVYLFFSNWIWFDELAVHPSRPIRPIFDAIFGKLARWTGRHFFHLTGSIEPNSFRDTRYNYLVLLSVVVISVFVTAGWILADRRGRTVKRVYDLMRVWIRYSLAYMVLIYAIDKVFRLQFPFPGLLRLIEPYGDSSPMALMWTFVGYSGVYTVFSGLAEAGGAVLLFWRRTVPIGAFILTGVMANVALMDFCYDVSVKMLALHFLIMSVFLLAHDAGRLLNVLVLNRPAPAVENGSLLTEKASPRTRQMMLAAKVLIVLYATVPPVIRTYKVFRAEGPFAPHPPLYGLYEVDSFAVNGSNRPLLITDGSVWRYVVVSSPTEVTAKTMDNTLIKLKAKYDPLTKSMEMRPQDAKSTVEKLALAALPQGGISVTGNLGGNKIAGQFRHVDVGKFILVSRGYHWINETSYSR